jgi:hypothetical protein
MDAVEKRKFFAPTGNKTPYSSHYSILFESKRKEITRGWRTVHNKELHTFPIKSCSVLKSSVFWDVRAYNPVKVN